MGSPNVQNPRARHVFAQNLRNVLARAELSEAELARRSGVSQKQVNNSARKRTGTGIEILTEMARALHVPAYQLMIPNCFTADAPTESTKLHELIVAYLRATPQERAAIDVVAQNAIQGMSTD